MIINLEELSPVQRYYQIIQTLIPRPVAWVLSEHGNGSYNLAPFSYFSAVCSDPALVMISVGKKACGEQKDTRANIEANKRFIVHIPDMQMLTVMNASGEALPAGVSEVEKLGLDTVPFEGFPLPRLSCAKVAYACELFDIHEMGHSGQSIIYGEVKAIYLDDSIIDSSVHEWVKVDAARLNPIAWLGGGEYAGLSSVLKLGDSN